jgi:small subunit ribosomal protein S19e
LIKTSHGNELSPLDADWFYYKAAAIVRQIYVSKSRNVGVGTLKTFFGRKKRNGVRPPKFIRSAGKIVRVIVRQLTPTFIEPLHVSTENTLGLGITKGGRAQLDKIANKVMKERSQ